VSWSISCAATGGCQRADKYAVCGWWACFVCEGACGAQRTVPQHAHTHTGHTGHTGCTPQECNTAHMREGLGHANILRWSEIICS
jgi:hypothetical protein